MQRCSLGTLHAVHRQHIIRVLRLAGHVSASEAAALRRALAHREDELNRIRRGLAGAEQVALLPETLQLGLRITKKPSLT